jgi:poly(A) polymerase
VVFGTTILGSNPSAPANKMLKKTKKIISKIDRYLFKKFGSSENIKSLENLKEAKFIFSLLNDFENDNKVRFVGGCIRKSMRGEDIDDIDLATSLKPDIVKKKLTDNGIKVVDSGIEHGTLTAILNKKKFEITTLREDVTTDGRHAEVKFTTDWEKDSCRRDLTINSIYGDIDGKIFDPQNGLNDLRDGIIKFIGKSEQRIQEDYLRIIRYFRFFLIYSQKDHDEEIIQAIKKNINGLNKISKERLFQETKKILSNDNIYSLFSNDKSKEIILNIFPQFKFYERLKDFNKLSEELKLKYDYGLILSILVVDQTDNYDFFCYKFKTPNHIKEKLKYISSNFQKLNNKNFYEKDSIKKLIYFNDKEKIKNILLFSRFAIKKIKDSELKNLLYYVESCNIPKFPITGEDLKNYGYKTGQELGKKLKSLEEKWVENNFQIDKKLVEKSLNKSN